MKFKFNIGDKVYCTDDGWLGQQELEVISVAVHRDEPVSYGCTDILGDYHFVYEDEIKLGTDPAPAKEELTGGPAGYYDLPYSEWITTNDMGEYLAKTRWLEYSLHFKDALKALVRFGSKGGTSKKYDIEKIIYSGCRALVMLSGRKAVRDYLQRLLDDPQFKV